MFRIAVVMGAVVAAFCSAACTPERGPSAPSVISPVSIAPSPVAPTEVPPKFRLFNNAAGN